MYRKKYVTYLFLVLALSACKLSNEVSGTSNSNPGVPSPSPGSSGDFTVSISHPVSTAAGDCAAFSLEVKNDQGDPTNVDADTSISVTAPGVKFYSTSDCSSAELSNIVIPKDSDSLDFYGYIGSGDPLVITVDDGENPPVVGDPIPSAEIQADIVIGHSDVSTNTGLRYGMDSPKGVFTDGTRLFVADEDDHRILIYNSIPGSSQEEPDVVLGQASHSHSLGGNGGSETATASGLKGPNNVYFDGTKLYVADSSNHRVLIWNSLPSSDMEEADVVIGQADFASDLANQGGAASDSTLSNPVSVIVVGTNLIVSDKGNNRVLIWNPIPTSNGVAASYVIGQPDFLTTMANEPGGTPTDENLSAPVEVASDGTALYVADNANNRVLKWNSIPSSNDARANMVLGQSLFTTNASAGGAGGMNNPYGVSVSGGKLLVADRDNHRVLLWNPVPVVSGEAADFVIGQPDMAGVSANNPSRSAATMSKPYSVSTDGTNIFVADESNYRILQWTAIPGADAVAANYFHGQGAADYSDTNSGGTDSQTIDGARGVSSDGTRLFVADYRHNRALIFNSVPTSSHANADIVLGQPDMNTATPDTGGISASTGDNTIGVFSDGTKLYAIEYDNKRVLGWDTMPTTDGEAADFVLGQPNFISSSTNNPALGLDSLAKSYAIGGDSSHLVVADHLNHRVLLWNSLPDSNCMPGCRAAGVALGQVDGTSNASPGTPTASTMREPSDVEVAGGKVFVADRGNNRILIWNSIPADGNHGAPADVVLGQPDFTVKVANNGGRSASSISWPNGVWSDGTKMAVSDTGNRRVLIWNSIPTSNNTPADIVIGQVNFVDFEKDFGPARMQMPFQLQGIGDKLWVVDDSGDRILRFPIPSW